MLRWIWIIYIFLWW